MSGSPRRCCGSPRAAAPTRRTARSICAWPGVSRDYGAAGGPRHRHGERAQHPARRRQSRLRHRPARRRSRWSAPPAAAGRSGAAGDPPTGRSPPTSSCSPAAAAHDRGQPADLRRDRLSPGRLVRTAAGPFAGTLTLGRAGAGRHGPARRRRPLSADRRRRRPRTARARRATIRSSSSAASSAPATPSSIREAPEIVGDAQLAGLASGDLVRRSRPRPDQLSRRQRPGAALRRGPARRLLPGRRQRRAAPRGDPRRHAGPGQQHPASASPSPPRSAARPADWVLQPVTVALRSRAGSGSPGAMATGLVIQSRLDEPRPLDPQRLLAGPRRRRPRHRQPRFRDAGGRCLPARGGAAQHRRLHPHRHRHPLGRRSTWPSPAACRPKAAQAAAVIRRGGAIIGRIAGAAAAARAGGGELAARGCSRRRSPAASAITARPTCRCPSPICRAISLPGRSRSAPISAAGCRTRNSPASSAPTNLIYVNEHYGTRVTNLAAPRPLRRVAARDHRIADRARRRARSSGRGTIGLVAAADFPIDLRLELRECPARALRRSRRDRDRHSARSSTTPPGALIAGELALGEVRYQFVRQAAAEVRAAGRACAAAASRSGRRTSRMPTPACRASGGSTSA